MSEETKLYPLTNSQKGLWYTEQFYPGTAIGNIVASTSLKETIDYGKLAIAVNLFIKRHDGVRLRITDNNLEPEQYIAEYQEKEFEYIDFSVQGGREAFYKWADIEAQVPFQLINSDLFHFCLFKISENEGGVFARIHHLISDAWTMALMCNEIGSSYKMLVNEGTIPDGNPPSYIDFIKSEQDFEKSIEFKSAKQFWDNLFDTIPETAALKPRREYTASTQAKRNNFNVNKELTHKIIQYSNRNKVSGFILFLSALSIYINRVTGKEDIIIGIPVLLRPTLKEQVTVGMFIDTVPVRLKIDQNLSCEKYITWVSQVWKEIRKHRYPYNRLLHDIRKKHHTQEMLYDIVLSYHKARVFLPGDLEACWFFSYSQTNSLCISVSDHENTGNLTIDVDYLAELFEEREIQQINDGLLTIIEDMVGNPGKKPSELEIISEQEKEQQLYEFNDTQADYPRGKTIHELFAEQVEKTPDKTAVVFEDKNLSYRELNDKASCLAKVLREKGVQPGEIVGLMVPRSLEMITGILAILKAGGAYLPIDTDYPPERIEYMLEDSGARLLLAQAGLMDRINFNGEILLIDDLNLDNGNNSNPANLNQPSDLAYLIYTSGSTGKPKGAMISHTNVVRLIKNSNTAFDFNDQDVWTLFHSIAFDFSVWEMYGVLLSGSTLVVVPKDITRDPAAFAKLLKSEGVTVLNQTPSAFYALLNEEEYKRLPGIRYVIFGGEALQPGKLKEWRKHHPETKLINMYGITETTVHVTYKEIQDHEIESNSANIGKPLPTTSVYIMDARQNLLPIGCAGEICVGGLGVGRGYLNRPELTEEKYICNPYIPKETIYRSGDLARWQADGTLEYLGRIDHQVKIRGYRIELGEIENCLLAWAVIKEAVVIDRNDADGDKYLCAYYVSESELPVTELRSHLAQALPHYMIPSYFIRLGELPLTPNGKIDRKALPGPEGKNNITADYVPPANDTEEILCRIWSEVLGIEKIGVFDNFFDLGGHSLKAIQMVYAISKKLKIDIEVRQVFHFPTIRTLAEKIQRSESGLGLYGEILPAEKREYYPLSSAQKRIMFIQQLDQESIAYNIPATIEIKGPLDVERLIRAMNKLIRRHEALRTSFVKIGYDYYQKIWLNTNFQLPCRKADAEELPMILADFVKPFKLEEKPPIRAELIRINNDKHILNFDIHHIIADGTSLNNIIQDLIEFYSGKEPPDLFIQYKDYVLWQNNYLQTEHIKRQESYWLQIMQEDIPVLRLPLDYPRIYLKSYEGRRIVFRTSKEQTEKLREMAAQNQTTLFTVLMCAYNVLLAKYSGQEDIIVGIPVIGRGQPEVARAAGMFANTLAIRSYPKADLSFNKFLESVKISIMDALDNQDYPFDKLLEQVKVTRDINRNPLFDTMFSMQEKDIATVKIDDIQLTIRKFEKADAKFDISLEAADKGGIIEFELEYCKGLFKPDTIERLAAHLIRIIEAIMADCEQQISAIQIISEQEKEQQLYEFNDTQSDYPRGKTIHELFAEQVGKTPDKTAVVFEDKNLSYRELNDKASCLAKVLREKGVQPGEIVGLMVPRSLEMITGILAILKAGGAYLPIDTDYPPERIEYMLEDSGARLLLAQAGLMDRINFNGEILLIDGLNLDNGNNSNPANLNQPSDLAYLIYTSGSTGKPKGAVISHTNVVRLIKNSNTAFDFNDQDVWTLFHSIAFDFSVWEMYGALLSGSTLVVVPKDITRDPAAFAKLLKSEGVTVLNQTPSAFYALLNEEEYKRLPGIRYVIFGGEVLQPGKLKEWRKHHPETKLINMYGITETTVHVTYKEIQDHEIESNSANIGKPLPTTSVYIMDARQNLLPIGCAGEICVGGLGVGRGYLNRPELTEEKYICNPYIPKETIYRSGDLARWQADGTLEYLGRIDHQVKIRGYRIELGEIENCLLAWVVIKEAVVIDRNDADGDKYLCAYYVSESELPVTELRSHLAQALPHYMIPSYFIRLGELPLTPNGKIDRKALPGPEGKNNITADYVPPANDTEEILCRIWSEVLGIEKIGVFDNFFDLGGHSLKVTSLILRMNKELSIDIMPRQIYSTPTIRELLLQISDYPCKKQNRSNENMICLKKGSKENKNVFLIHDGSGEIGQYSELCKLLSSDITCWGISFQQPAGYLPIKTRVEELAGKYIISIKEIQADGPYHIVGGCIGGIIAYEAVSQLEIHGDQVGLLALMDSPAPEKVMNDINFNIDAEKRLINYLFTDPDLNKEMNQIKEIGKLWEVTVERLQGKPEVLKNARKRLPAPIARMRQFTETDLAGFVYYLCVNRILNDAVSSYAPSRRVKAPVYYFEAINDNIIRDQTANLKNWELCCQNKLNRIIAVTNHFEMYNLPDIKKLVNLLEDRMLGGKQAKY